MKGFEYQTKLSLYYVGDRELWRVLHRELESDPLCLLDIADRKYGAGYGVHKKGGHLVGASPHPWGVRGLPEKGPGPIFEVFPGTFLFV